MKRSIKDIEYEIVHQILISELCFDICGSIKIIPGRGSDFLPYYYNLNFIKGLISLHSLLLSHKESELSIKNYIEEYEKKFSQMDINDFKTHIISISKSFKKAFHLPLRHKIGAHIDENFKHVDFTCAYIMPSLIPKYIAITRQLKNTFFKFSNYSKNNNPYQKIKQQSDSILKNIV